MAKQKATISPVSSRIKAFIVDTFIILMPILYIAAYVILDGKDDFQRSQMAILVCNMTFGVIYALFVSISAQTPGYKSQQIYLINLKTGQRIGFTIAILRYICFIFAGFSIIGIILCFFRKDNLNIHDLLTNTAPVVKKDNPNNTKS